jgi:hypothetical protein
MKKLFFLLSVLAIVSCNKEQDVTDKCTEPFHDITSPDLLNNKLKQGTYWIYLDSVSMTTDSTIVTSSSEGNVGACQEYHAYGYNLTSYPTLLGSNIAIYAGLIEKNTGGLPGSGIKIYTDFNYPDSSSSFTCSRLDSCFIYDRYYKRVEKVVVAQDPSNPGRTKSIYYFNSDYGILRHDRFNSSNALVWKKLLKRKNMVR